jgi:DNA-directed RNA polymerase subunit RPC12/RpoP
MDYRYLCLRCGHIWEEASRAGMTADPLCPQCSGRSAMLSADVKDLSVDPDEGLWDGVTYQLCTRCQEILPEERTQLCDVCQRLYCGDCYPKHQDEPSHRWS